ncbi:fukutin-like [Amphibalanus amphitrite]|uniref:fukutin-like n=1 Tax=Amphibalanus amphitrite TaxID=1232801 RepID=UPI001C904529|nr:fukutin-like [Amphibalanus amphitrite]XP_043242710.1 fukutin-like [Amphibalanus amphitrite]XP_043242719.1 fukutin-like [Amphibalanus amphitrite]
MTPARHRACNRTLAAAYHRLAPREEGPDADRFRRRAWALLAAAVSACNTLGVPHWLGSGTLLGYIRQCDLVSAMDDVDIEVAVEPFVNDNVTVTQLVETLNSAGLVLASKFGRLNDSLEMAFEDENGMRIDVFFSYPDRESRYIAGVDTITRKKYRWVYPEITLCWGTLHGLVVGVPCDSERYLETNYGTNWTQPLPPGKTFDYRRDNANMVDAGWWGKEEESEVIQLFNR